MKQKLKIAKKIAKVGNVQFQFCLGLKNQSNFKTIYIQNKELFYLVLV